MTSILLALLLTNQAPAGAAQAGAAAAQQQAVETLERRWLAAENDPAALESILADDFIHVLPLGFITKKEQLDYLRSHPAPSDGTTRRFDDLRVRVYGTAAVVTGIVVATSPDGTVGKTAFTDVFAYRDRTWRAVSAQELPLSGAARLH